MPVKVEEGKEFHAGDFFYVPDPESPSTWKLKKGGEPGKVDRVHVSAAAAALGPNPPHGKGVDIPAEDKAGVKRKIRGAMRELGYEEDEIPEWLFGEGKREEHRQTQTDTDSHGQEIEIEVFAVGDYGEKGQWSERDLEGIVRDYDTKLHEAPVTIDHKQSGPAFGWVRGLRRIGGKLIAKLGDMAGELIEAVKGKRYKKVSVEIYKELKETGRPYLRAVSFLGAQVPEVKGLAAVELREDGEWTEMDMMDDMDKQLRKGGEEEMAENEKLNGLEKQVEDLKGQLEKAEQEKAAAEQAQKETEARFAEEEQKREIERAHAKAKAWVDQQVAAGYVTPAQEKAGLPELLQFCDLVPDDAVILFGEGKARPGDVLRDVLTKVKILSFEEAAPNEAEKKSDIATFAEKAKAIGVTVQQYKAAVDESEKAGNRFTPEQYIEANPEEFGK